MSKSALARRVRPRPCCEPIAREAAKEAVAFEVLQRIDRPNQFAVLGAWADQKAYEAHAGGAAAKAMNEKLARMLAAPNDTRQHNGLAVAPGKTGRGATFAVTHVDVIPPQKDNGVSAVQQLAEESRKHAGNLRFDVWQQTNRPNHFTVVEAWTSRGAFDVHGVQPPDRRISQQARLDDRRAVRRAALPHAALTRKANARRVSAGRGVMLFNDRGEAYAVLRLPAAGLPRSVRTSKLTF